MLLSFVHACYVDKVMFRTHFQGTIIPRIFAQVHNKRGGNDVLAQVHKKRGGSNVLAQIHKKRGGSNVLAQIHKKRGGSNVLAQIHKKRGSSDVLIIFSVVVFPIVVITSYIVAEYIHAKPVLKAIARKEPRVCNPDFTRCRGAAVLEGEEDPLLGYFC